jgi:radical SAM superfamily enzyme YgiQ (UPF0313 family)
MQFLILAENSRNSITNWGYFRSIAANELRKRIELAGHECTVIEWFRSWDKNDLIKIVDKIFKDAKNPVLAISSTLDMGSTDLMYLQFLFEYVKSNYKNSKIIRGGQRSFKKREQNLYKYIDIEFLSRSMGMFQDWLDGKDISKYKISENPLMLVNNDVNRSIDTPLVYKLYDDEFLTQYESLGFEVGVGCKFNCSFCDYTLRNAKNVTLNDASKLKELFETAYNKYGIKNFYSIDDTLNETEEKLEIIYDAIKDLSFKPMISGWCRLDLLHKPKQRELFKKINFSEVYFGIESFNPEASKFVRKKTGIENVYNSLEFMRDECPDTFTIGSFIIGLKNDSYESIMNGFDKAAKEKLLDSIQVFPYTFTSDEETYTDITSISEIEKNPEKFGYEVVRSPINNMRVGWKTNWTDHDSASYISLEIRSKYKDDFFILNHGELSAFRFLNFIKNKGTSEDKSNVRKLREKSLMMSNYFKRQYIERKKNQLGI